MNTLKKLTSLLIIIFAVAQVSAQGGISAEQLATVKKGYQNTAESRALRNAIVTNDISK